MKVASIILIVGFLSIIINQGIWIYNMKKTYYEDYSLFFNNLLNIYVQQERVGSLPFDLFEMDKYLQKRLDALNLMFIYKLELYENGRMVNTIGCDVKKRRWLCLYLSVYKNFWCFIFAMFDSYSLLFYYRENEKN